MRMILLLALAGCAAAPAEFVRPGESAVAVQMRADRQCIAWLANGVRSEQQGPLRFERGHFIHEPNPIIRRRGAACAFGWRDNMCVCRVEEFRNDGFMTSAGFVGETITFSACAELHRRHEL